MFRQERNMREAPHFRAKRGMCGTVSQGMGDRALVSRERTAAPHSRAQGWRTAPCPHGQCPRPSEPQIPFSPIPHPSTRHRGWRGDSRGLRSAPVEFQHSKVTS